MYLRVYRQRHGLEIGAISLQNEPDLVTKYSSCTWNGGQFRDFIRDHLKPTFERDGITAKVVVGEASNFGEKHVQETLADPVAAARLDIVATHACDKSFEKKAQPLPLARSQGKRIWMTEVSYFETNNPSIKDGLKWAQLIHNHLTISDVNAWFYWWGACYKTNGESLITMDLKNRTFATTKRLFTFGNFSRFVRPGYVRLGCDPNPAPGVSVTAFRGGDKGPLVVVAINSGETAQQIEYRLDGCQVKSFTPYRTSASENLVRLDNVKPDQGRLLVSLPAQSVTSFVASSVKPVTSKP